MNMIHLTLLGAVIDDDMVLVLTGPYRAVQALWYVIGKTGLRG